MEIIKGKILTAQKIVIYGPEGVGKTTFASQFPDPLFIDTEGSTNNIDAARLKKPSSWTMLLEQINFVKRDMPCKTLVIDTVDWAERLCIEFVCARAKKDSITKFGYGEGFIQLEEEFGRLLNKLSDLIEIGINVGLTAHAKITKFEQPDEFGAYDRWELKLGNKTTAKTSSLVKEWADMLLFANYKTVSVATNDKGTKFKGQGKTRVMYTSHHPAWDAKNRHGLQEELPFDYTQISQCIPGSSIKTPHQKKLSSEKLSENKVPEGFTVSPDTTGDDNSFVSSTHTTERKMDTPPAHEQPKIKAEPTPPPEEPPKEQTQEPPVHDSALPPGIPKGLSDLMMIHRVFPEEIQKVVSGKGYYPVQTPISNYDPSFIEGVLIGAWPQVLKVIIENREQIDDDIPF